MMSFGLALQNPEQTARTYNAQTHPSQISKKSPAPPEQAARVSMCQGEWRRIARVLQQALGKRQTRPLVNGNPFARGHVCQLRSLVLPALECTLPFNAAQRAPPVVLRAASFPYRARASCCTSIPPRVRVALLLIRATRVWHQP